MPKLSKLPNVLASRSPSYDLRVGSSIVKTFWHQIGPMTTALTLQFHCWITDSVNWILGLMNLHHSVSEFMRLLPFTITASTSTSSSSTSTSYTYQQDFQNVLKLYEDDLPCAISFPSKLLPVAAQMESCFYTQYSRKGFGTTH